MENKKKSRMISLTKEEVASSAKFILSYVMSEWHTKETNKFKIIKDNCGFRNADELLLFLRELPNIEIYEGIHSPEEYAKLKMQEQNFEYLEFVDLEGLGKELLENTNTIYLDFGMMQYTGYDPRILEMFSIGENDLSEEEEINTQDLDEPKFGM